MDRSDTTSTVLEIRGWPSPVEIADSASAGRSLAPLNPPPVGVLPPQTRKKAISGAANARATHSHKAIHSGSQRMGSLRIGTAPFPSKTVSLKGPEAEASSQVSSREEDVIGLCQPGMTNRIGERLNMVGMTKGARRPGIGMETRSGKAAGIPERGIAVVSRVTHRETGCGI
jgi:hypothetical protein